MEYLITPAAELGRYYTDIAAAISGEQEKEKKITLKCVSAEYSFSLDDPPTAGQMTAQKFPVTVSEVTGRLFCAVFRGRMQKKGFDAVLRIDASLYAARLYINGRLAASIENSLCYRDVRVDTFLDAENTLFLEILENSGQEDVIRGLSLFYQPKSCISDAFLRSRTRPDGVELFADITVTAGDVGMALGGSVAMYLLGDNGEILAEDETAIPAFQKKYWASARTSVTLLLPRLWSLDDPYRHTVLFALTRLDKTVSDVRRLEYGVRELRLTRYNRNKRSGPSLLLNGVPVKIRGALTGRQDAASVRKIKATGFNAVRLIDPVNPAFIEACEKNGMLVMCEASFSVKPNPRQRGSKKAELPDPLDRPVALVGEMVSRYRNNASVVCWSLGSRGSFGYGVLRELIHSMDDTRAVNCEGDLRFVASDFYTAADCGEEELFLLLSEKTISDGRLFGVRVPFDRYANRPFLLSEAAPDIPALKKKYEIMESHGRFLGLFVDCGGAEDYRVFSAIFKDAGQEGEKTEVEQTTLEEKSVAVTDE